MCLFFSYTSFLLILSTTHFSSHKWAPSVMCVFLENQKKIGRTQNKDVTTAAAAWLTHACVIWSESLWAPVLHPVLSGLMRAFCLSGTAAAAVWWVENVADGSALSSHQAIYWCFQCDTCAILEQGTLREFVQDAALQPEPLCCPWAASLNSN